MNLAKTFKMSGVALGKICKKNRIPVPFPGYWQMLAAGKRIKKPPLPSRKGVDKVVIFLKDTPVPHVITAQAMARIAQENLPSLRIVVPEKLAKPHDLTLGVKTALFSATLDKFGMRTCHVPETFRVRVSPASEKRALAIIDTLVKACEKRGFRIIPGEKREGAHAKFAVGRETVSISLEERAKQSKHIPTSEELDSVRHRMGFLTKYDFAPSGELTLKIDGGFWGGSPRTVWADKPSVKIEEKLNDVVKSLIEITEIDRQQRVEKEEAERNAVLTAIQELEKRKALETERLAITKLEDDAGKWRRAQAIRDYLAAHEARPGGSPDQTAWLEWGRLQADRLDPLCDSPTPNDDREAPTAGETPPTKTLT